MSQEEIRDYFASYRAALARIERVEELYARIYATATGGGIIPNSVGYVSGGLKEDVIGNAVCLLDSTGEKLKARKEEAEEIRQGILYLTGLIPDKVMRDVLRMTYIDCRDRRYIARELGCTLQAVTNHRRIGIEEIANKLN